MGFSISTSGMKSLRNYAQANEHFNNTKKPRSNRWDHNQRPLRDTRSTHMMLRQGPDAEYYDLLLYQTPLIRYYKPDAEGNYRVWLEGWNSQSSNKFMWAMGWYYRMRLGHDGGGSFELPISAQTGRARELWGDGFTVKLTFNKDGHVVRDKSIYIPVCGYRSSTTQRAKRKKFREDIATIMDMVDMRFGEFQSKCVVNSELGEPFSSNITANTAKAQRDTQHLLESFVRGVIPVDLTPAIHFAFDYAQLAYDNMVNRAAYKMMPHTNWHYVDGEWRRKVNDGSYPINETPLDDQPAHIKEKLLPTQEAVRKAVENRLVMLAGLDGGDTPTPYPLWANELPKTVYGIPSGLAPADLFIGSNTDNLLAIAKGG